PYVARSIEQAHRSGREAGGSEAVRPYPAAAPSSFNGGGWAGTFFLPEPPVSRPTQIRNNRRDQRHQTCGAYKPLHAIAMQTILENGPRNADPKGRCGMTPLENGGSAERCGPFRRQSPITVRTTTAQISGILGGNCIVGFGESQ